MITAFDDTQLIHKSITGAAAEGTSLRLRVLLPRSFGVYGCRLLLQRDQEEFEHIPMEWDCTNGYDEWWKKDISLPAGLYFYHFEFETSWGVTVLRKHKNNRSAGVDGAEEWQLTVYDDNFKTPEEIKGGIIYQIFPDRFNCSGTVKKNVPGDRIIHSDKSELPEYMPDKDGNIKNNDYFGGDLKGIEQKIPYIASLGVNMIYLNPIFEAHSNHRYNTADYMKIDPLLGTEGDFISLCETAHKAGIRIIIDGVFSHTGDDSIYFNKLNRYSNTGAYQSKESPYYSWYRFKENRDDYACWWNIDTLPEVNETDPSFCDFITGENGVIDKWLSLGADGLRLDVADELPDAFIDRVRAAVKKHGADKYLLGEVWEDASNKISHGGRRHYFDGRQLDGVMNYPFRNAIIDFVLTSDAPKFMNNVCSVVLNYPPQAMSVCMNLLGTHDTERILTVLAGVNCENMTREMQANISYTEPQLAHAKKLLRIAAAINYFLPGIPSLYYGDEAGMTGGRDPFNRCFYPWGREDEELLEYFRFLGRLRRGYPVLASGGFYPLSAALGCAAFLRYSEGEKRVAVIANKNPDEIRYELNADMRDMVCVYGGRSDAGAVVIPPETAAIITD